ncbi:serine hydrolase [uncultured Cetobacterium sp.]|uniref:serine hydrolase n=1 Tax=uncultured Cetobacterium sp. TaxID=527638 RepID=UPI0026062D5B|nr:serine hydrolase [uncultured Cetobacterium sp.]
MPREIDDLNKQIDVIINEFQGEVGIIVKENTKNIFSKNETKVFQSASIIKLFILEAMIEKIENKTLHYNEKITIKEDEKVPGFGVLKLLDKNLSITIKDLATLMITLSDNTATNILIDILGIDFIQEFIRRKGYFETKLERKMFDNVAREKGLDNYTSARDSFRVLKNLSANSIALDMLKNQLCNSKIPLYFFRKIDVAHKTGDLTNIEHDVGTLFFKNTSVDLIILAQGDNRDAVLLNNYLGEVIYNYYK